MNQSIEYQLGNIIILKEQQKQLIANAFLKQPSILTDEDLQNHLRGLYVRSGKLLNKNEFLLELEKLKEKGSDLINESASGGGLRGKSFFLNFRSGGKHKKLQNCSVMHQNAAK